MAKFQKFTIEGSDTLTDVLAKIKDAFSAVGWFIYSEGDDFVTVRSPQAFSPTKYLFCQFKIFPDKNLIYGVNASVYREIDEWDAPAGDPITFGSTINAIGEYVLAANNTSFFLIPPRTQTHRYRYGTWAGLLKVPNDAPVAISSGNYIPLFFLSDRKEGANLREHPHTDPTSPTHAIVTPSGLIFNTFLPLRYTHGYRWAQDRGVSKMVIGNLILGAVFGETLLPILYSPDIFLIWKPERQFYFAPPSTEKDFLVEIESPVGTLMPTAEAPPDGAIICLK